MASSQIWKNEKKVRLSKEVLTSDVLFPGFSNLPVNGKLPVNCHNLPVNYQEFLKRAVDHVKLKQNIHSFTFSVISA